MWLRRTRVPAGAVAASLRAPAFGEAAVPGFGGFADPPFVIVIVAGPSMARSAPPADAVDSPGEMTRPSPPGEGPVGLRW